MRDEQGWAVVFRQDESAYLRSLCPTLLKPKNSLNMAVCNRKNIMKIVLVILLVLVVLSLFSGLYFMYRNKGNPNLMVNALKLRVALSITAFLIVIGGFIFGWFPRV